MAVSFIKYECGGQTFLCPESGVADAALASTLCDPRTGAGAGCVLFFSRGERADAEAISISAGGAQVPLSDQALFTAAKYLYDTAWVNCTELCIFADGNTHRLSIENRGGKAWGVSADMGYPVLDACRIPHTGKGLIREEEVVFGASRNRLSCVSVGEPFAILDGSRPFSEEDLPTLQHNFPDGATVLALTRQETNRLSVRSVARRGIPFGLFRAACAAAVSAAISGNADFREKISVTVDGVACFVTVSPHLHLFLTCEVQEVLRGNME